MRCRMTEIPSSLTPKSSRRSRMSCAREIDVGEHQLRLRLRRNEPAGFDPGLQQVVLEAGSDQKFLDRDHFKPPSAGGGFELAPLASVVRIPRAPDRAAAAARS